ncbi:LysR family transcriptional regulator [Xanthobacter sp. VNH20]|uniref:LysR family transcriptional regulator n=1 Tax=Xanthobacter sp. VNH20 TaxID=3156616 RepID=UPI0032B3B7F4
MPISLVPAALRYAEQVARSGSIQRAAKDLNVAASAINRQILQLEEALGVALFERIPKGMRATPAGDVMITLARRWRADERRAAAELREVRGVSQGHVRLAAMDSHVNGILPALIAELETRYPRISLDVEVMSTDAAVAALISGEADIAAVFNLSPHRDIHVRWTVELPFGCVVAPDHPLAQRPSVSLQEVVAFPLALQSRALMIRRYLEARHGWLFADNRKILETNSLQLAKILAREGSHVTLTSELDAAPELVAGTLVFRPVRDSSAEPQSASIAIDGRKPLTRVGRVVAELLEGLITTVLADARGS